MQTLLYVELNFFAVAILAIILQNLKWKNKKNIHEQRFYIALIFANIAVLLLDTGMWLLDGASGEMMRGLNTTATTMYYAMNPLCCYLFVLYMQGQMNASGGRKRMNAVLFIPVAASAVLSVASVFNGLYFYIDAENAYHRGEFFYVMAAVCYFYFLYSCISVYLQSRHQKRNFWPVIAVALPPMAAGVLQIAVEGVSVIWISMTLSILIAFVKFQNQQLHTDHLTGLYNRRHLDYYMNRLADNQEQIYGGIMIDLNSFKTINDRYGHTTGDRALESTAGILQKTFRKSDFIARYGGDEFVVVMELNDRSDLEQGILRLKHNVQLYNSQSTEPYRINLSIGYDIYKSNAASADEFIKHIDTLMYIDKAKKEGR